MENITDEFLNTYINDNINTKIRNSVSGKQLTVNRRNKTKLRKHFEQLNILRQKEIRLQRREEAKEQRKIDQSTSELKQRSK